MNGMALYSFHKWMIGIAISLLCFINSVQWVRDGGDSMSNFILLPAFIVWIISSAFYHKKILLPHGIGAKCFLLFLAVCMCSDVANFTNIARSEDPTKNGILFSLMKLISMALYLGIALYVYNFFRNYRGDVYRFFFRCLLVSFFLSSFYSFFELLRFTYPPAGIILSFLDSLFRAHSGSFVFKVRSLTYEYSTLGSYLAIIFPYLFAMVISKKKKYFFFLGFMLLMAFGTFSRTVYFLLVIQCIVFFFLFRKKYFFQFSKIIIITGAILLVGVELFINSGTLAGLDPMEVFLSFTDDSDSHRVTSNVMRIGSQIGALNIFVDYPILGVGLGQATFHLLDYVPNWIWLSSDMTNFATNMPVFGTYPRILCETGIFGFLVWVALWLDALHDLFVKDHGRRYLQRVTIFMSILGLLIAGLNWDMLSFPGLWIYLGLAWYVRYEMDVQREQAVLSLGGKDFK